MSPSYIETGSLTTCNRLSPLQIYKQPSLTIAAWSVPGTNATPISFEFCRHGAHHSRGRHRGPQLSWVICRSFAAAPECSTPGNDGPNIGRFSPFDLPRRYPADRADFLQATHRASAEMRLDCCPQ